MSVMAVVQFGFAMIPWWFLMSPPLISGTIRGTDSDMRNADELSTTTAPEFTATGPNSLEIPDPALKRATSIPSNEFMPSVSIRTSSPRNFSVFPADRAEARSLRLDRGKLRRSITRSISTPTAPDAPTIATR